MFSTTVMILVRCVKYSIAYSIFKVVKERFCNIIYLNTVLPYSSFQGIQKFCVIVFVCLLHWKNEIEKKKKFLQKFQSLLHYKWNLKFLKKLIFLSISLFQHLNIVWKDMPCYDVNLIWRGFFLVILRSPTC